MKFILVYEYSGARVLCVIGSKGGEGVSKSRRRCSWVAMVPRSLG